MQRSIKSLSRHLAAALVPLLCLAACSRNPEPLKVGGNIWPGYAPLYIAHGLEYFKGTGVDVYILPNAVEVMRAYRNRAIDVAAVTADEALLMAQDDPEQRIILVCDYSLGADMIVAAPTVASLADLRGKRIGVESGALGAFVLDRALGAAGLGARDITTVTCEMENMEQKFATGDIAAAVVFEPFGSRLLARGGHRIFDSRQIPGEIIDVLITRKSAIDAAPGGMAALTANWFRAVDLIRARPDDAARLAKTYCRVEADIFLQSLGEMEIVGRPENGRLLGKSPRNLEVTLRRLEALMRREKLLTAPVEVGRMPEDRFVR